jgi:membrane protein DedA with SNARE-associated domain
MGGILEIMGLFLLSSVKFLFAPATAIALGYNLPKTIIITFCGGSFGITVFYYLGAAISNWWTKHKKTPKKKKKVFTATNRKIVFIKNKYGLIGLCIITPGIISIPVGSILAAKYFRHDKRTFPFLIASLFIWCITLSMLAYFFKIGINA